MKQSFWKDKPLIVDNIVQHRQILSNESLLSLVNKQLKESNLKLNYKLYKPNELSDEKIDEILLFINDNYLTGKSNFKLFYTVDLLKFYCKNSLVLEFYPCMNKYKYPVGYIIGKKTPLIINNNTLDFLEVNFLCLTDKLRNLGLCPYMINSLTKESILNFNIGIAHYTIDIPIKSPFFSKKEIYHRIINIDTLVKTKFISIKNDYELQNLKSIYNSFNYDKSKYNIILLKNSKQINVELSIYNLYNLYTNNTYDIYDKMTLDDLYDIIDNKDFYNFIVLDEYNQVLAFISMFKLYTNTDNGIYRNGYYYKICFKNTEIIVDCLELVNEYIYKNCLLDVVSFFDIFDIKPDEMKCIIGSSNLKYYLFNYSVNEIKNIKNGLITI